MKPLEQKDVIHVDDWNVIKRVILRPVPVIPLSRLREVVEGLKKRKCKARDIDHLPTVKVPCNTCQECYDLDEAFGKALEEKGES